MNPSSRRYGSTTILGLSVLAAILVCASGLAQNRPKDLDEPLVAARAEVVARVTDTEPCCPSATTLAIEKGNTERSLRLTGRLERLDRLMLVASDRLVLAGDLPRAGGTELLIANLDTLRQEQSLWTYGYSVSPSGRWLVYQTHYPRMVPAEARRSIFLLYDLSKPPEENRSGPESSWPEPNLGRPVFPEENVRERTWSIFASNRSFGLNSPFLWSEDERQLVFIAASYLGSADWPTCFIIDVRLSATGEVDSVRERKLTEENVTMPFRTAAYDMEYDSKPLCLIASELTWAEDEDSQKVVAFPSLGSSLGSRITIELP